MADKPVHSQAGSDKPLEYKPKDASEESLSEAGPEDKKAEGTGAEYAEDPAIVIHCGSEMCRVGYAGDDYPKCEFHTVVGRLKQQAGVRSAEETYIGENARAKQSILDISSPIEHGVVTNWDDMEALWHYIFKEKLDISSKDRNVVLTEPSVNPTINREKMVQIMFETFEASGVSVINQPLLALYASGRTSGLVLDCGFGLTQVVPVLEGHVVSEGIVTSKLAGNNLTLHMAEMMSQRGGFSFHSNAMTEDADALKKMCCYVAQNFDQELRDIAEKSYNLPHGEIIKSINLGSERIKCPEGLFKPYLLGTDESGVHEKIYHSILKCDRNIHEVIYANIVLAGGSTLFPNFAGRLLKEVKSLAAPDTNVKVIAAPERIQASWIGGSIVGSLRAFRPSCITKEDYDETGPTIVHSKSVW